MTQPICDVCGKSVNAVVRFDGAWSCIAHLPSTECDHCYALAKPIGVEQYAITTMWTDAYDRTQSIGYRCPSGHLSHRDGGMGPGHGRPKAPPVVVSEVAVYVSGVRLEEAR